MTRRPRASGWRISSVKVPSDWRCLARCRGVGHERWFDQDEAAAKRICSECEVWEECLAYAIAQDIQDGVWGGMNPTERTKFRRGRGIIRCPSCRGSSLLTQGQSVECLDCGHRW